MFHQFKNTSYYGGQGGTGHAQIIINHIPNCLLYVEPFLGHSSVIRSLKKIPTSGIVGYDLDKKVIDKWNESLPGHIDVINSDYAAAQSHSLFSADHTVTFHFDPPYRNTKSPKQYSFDLIDDREYKRFLEVCVTISHSQFVLISHWKDELFDHVLGDKFYHLPFTTQSRRGKMKNGLYISNNCIGQPLLDYSYAGTDYTDRQRIDRKCKRMYNKIMTMSDQERGKLFQLLQLDTAT